MIREMFKEPQVNLRFSRQFMPPGERLNQGCVVIAEEAAFRIALVKQLKEIKTIRFLTEGSQTQHIPTKLNRIIPDLAFVNVKIGGPNPISTVRILKEWYPQLLVLVISEYTAPALVKRILLTGANGYLLNRSQTTHLNEAVRSVLAGKLYIDSALINSLLENLNDKDQPVTHYGDGIEFLSDKEFNIFVLLGQGLTYRQIALTAKYSLSSVRSCLQSLGRQLKLNSNADLREYAEKWIAVTL